MKTKYHAVMLDETRCEFGVSVEARTREEAYRILEEDYAESRCVQLESPADTRKREKRIDAWARRSQDNEDTFGEYAGYGDDDHGWGI
jgi:hypothetical protein